MGIFNNLFGKRRRTLKDLTLDDLTRERITLQGEQRKLDQELQRQDRDEGQLKNEYTVAGSPTQKKSIARKIQDVRTRRQAAETKAGYCHKMLQTVNNFLLIKENMAFFDRMGVASLLTNMDMAEIEAFIQQATIEGTLQQEKLASMLQQVSDGVEQMTQSAPDSSLENLMAELDAEAAISRSTISVATTDPAVDEVMRDLDAAIARGEQVAKQAQQPAKPQREPERS